MKLRVWVRAKASLLATTSLSLILILPPQCLAQLSQYVSWFVASCLGPRTRRTSLDSRFSYWAWANFALIYALDMCNTCALTKLNPLLPVCRQFNTWARTGSRNLSTHLAISNLACFAFRSSSASSLSLSLSCPFAWTISWPTEFSHPTRPDICVEFSPPPAPAPSHSL